MRRVEQCGFQRGRAASHPSDFGSLKDVLRLAKHHLHTLFLGQGIIVLCPTRSPRNDHVLHGPFALHGAFQCAIQQHGQVVLDLLQPGAWEQGEGK